MPTVSFYFLTLGRWKSRFALSSLSWQLCWKIATLQIKTSSPDKGGQYPLSPTERHSFRCLHCPIDSETNHALALLLILNTEATIAANTSPKAFDFVDSLHKDQQLLLAVSQYGAQLFLPSMYRSREPLLQLER